MGAERAGSGCSEERAAGWLPPLSISQQPRSGCLCHYADRVLAPGVLLPEARSKASRGGQQLLEAWPRASNATWQRLSARRRGCRFTAHHQQGSVGEQPPRSHCLKLAAGWRPMLDSVMLMEAIRCPPQGDVFELWPPNDMDIKTQV